MAGLVLHSSSVFQLNFSAKQKILRFEFHHIAKPETLTFKPKEMTVYKINDIIRQQIRNINHQTAEPKAKASAFLFFATAHFLNPILASRIPKAFESTFAFALTHKPILRKTKRAIFLPTLYSPTSIKYSILAYI